MISNVTMVRRYMLMTLLTILLAQMLTMAVILCGPCIEHQDRYGFPVIYLMPLALAALSCALRRTQRN